MAIDVLHLLSKFEEVDDREGETAYYRTHVPWVGPLAYLNIVFKPAPEDVLPVVAKRVRMPLPLIQFLRRHNGAVLFSGSLSVYGIHRPGQLLNREDKLFDLPFNIEDENYNWPPSDRTRFLGIGGYGFDGSTICIDREDFSVHLFERGQETLVRDASCSWPSLNEWLTSEIARLSILFDERGRRLVDESKTLPQSTPTS